MHLVQLCLQHSWLASRTVLQPGLTVSNSTRLQCQIPEYLSFRSICFNLQHSTFFILCYLFIICLLEWLIPRINSLRGREICSRCMWISFIMDYKTVVCNLIKEDNKEAKHRIEEEKYSHPFMKLRKLIQNSKIKDRTFDILPNSNNCAYWFF